MYFVQYQDIPWLYFRWEKRASPGQSGVPVGIYQGKYEWAGRPGVGDCSLRLLQVIWTIWILIYFRSIIPCFIIQCPGNKKMANNSFTGTGKIIKLLFYFVKSIQNHSDSHFENISDPDWVAKHLWQLVEECKDLWQYLTYYLGYFLVYRTPCHPP